MAKQAKARHKRAAAKPRGSSKPDPFRMVVAANPGESATVDPELDLLKAALLYGDKVTMLSPVTTMFLRVEGLARFSPLQQLELMRRAAPLFMPEEEVPAFQVGLAQVDKVLRSSPYNAGLLQKFAPLQRQLAEAVQGITDDAGIDQLARARAEGLIEIENVDPGDVMDLLISCMLSARLAESGQRNEDGHLERIAAAFVDSLSRHLSSGKEYLVFDAPIANLTDAAIREGVFTPARGPAGRCAQAMTASAFMSRLPTFPMASVDEVLDIRSELAPALTHFRSAMVTASKPIGSAPWETDFEDCVHDEWIEKVHPAIEEIRASVRDNSSLMTLVAESTGVANKAYPGLALFGSALATHHPSAAAVGGAVAIATPILQALRERKKTNNAIRMQPFYFLYAANAALS